MSRFRLATVERLRQRQVEACVRALAEAAAAHAAADRLCGELRLQLHASVPFSALAQDLATGAAYRQRLRDDLQTVVGQVQRLAEAREEARQAWIAARTRLRAVEVLHERHRAQVRVALARAEQRELDDLARRVSVGGER